MKIVKKDVSELDECRYNPRNISDIERKGLSNSLDEFGLVLPIVWNERTGNVVGGNQRLNILKERGVKEIDVVVVDLDDVKEKALNLALNNPHIQGKFSEDVDKLIEEIRVNDMLLFDDLRIQDIHSDVDAEVIMDTDDEGHYIEIPDLEVKPFEHFDYFTVVVDNVQDWQWLSEKMDIKTVNSSPVGKRKVGKSRAMWFRDFVRKIGGKDGG